MATILCLDDHTLSLSSIVDTLRHSGYGIAFTGDARALLELLAESSVDAVLLDCHELGRAGGDLVGAVRMVRPDVPIVMMSAYCCLPCTHLQHADACIQKGATRSNLKRTLDAVLCASRFGLCRSVAA